MFRWPGRALKKESEAATTYALELSHFADRPRRILQIVLVAWQCAPVFLDFLAATKIIYSYL